ncbi:MAG: cupin domain-containing protein [Chloroflexota bacterium]
MNQQLEPNVGLRLRMLRVRQGLSLRALAQQCGLSVNAISQIERGEHSPTVSSLHLLATALNVPITAFFEDSRDQMTILVRHDQRLRSQSDGFIMESLGIGLADQQLEPFLVVVEPGARNATDPITHSGEEFVYCIDGIIDYRVGDELYQLEAGDSLLFEAVQPHSFSNAGHQSAILIMIFQTAQGSQMAGRQHLAT